MQRPNWTVVYSIVSKENSTWIGTGWEFFDEESDARKCYDRHNSSGNTAKIRRYTPKVDEEVLEFPYS